MLIPSSSVGVQDNTFGSVPLVLAERFLDALALPSGEHAGVLGGNHPEDTAVEVETPVIVTGRRRIVRHDEPSAAPVSKAPLPHPIGYAGGRHGLLPRAGVTAHTGLGGLVIAEPDHVDMS